MSHYLFDQAWTAETRRQEALCRLYDPGTIQHLIELGVGPGWRCLEAGAGTGSVARWLAESVGPHGHVVATDLDPRFFQSMGDGIEMRKHDIVRDPLEERAFDLVHTRALLMHLPERANVLKRLVAALKPGGCLLAEDIIMLSLASEPALPGYAKIINVFVAAFRRRGADPFYGIQLPLALEGAGLLGVGNQARAPVALTGTPSADVSALSLEQVGPALVAAGALTEDEVAEGVRQVRTPGHAVLPPLMVAAWGHRASS